MVRPSDFPSPRKEGLRCDKKRLVNAPGGRWRSIPEVVNHEECSALLLEQGGHGLGLRCDKKDCKEFHPIEVLLSRAVEEELLGPDQLERIQNAVSASQNSEQVHPEFVEGEKEMTPGTATKDAVVEAKHTIEINPPIFIGPYPGDAIDAVKALEQKRQEIWAELLELHFPTFDNGEMKSFASHVMWYVAEGDLDSVDIVAQGDAGHYSVWIELRFKSEESKIKNMQTSWWSIQSIAMDVAYKIQSFLNLVKVPCVLVDRINNSGITGP